MIDKLNLGTYYKVAQMSQSLNRYVREALITKTQLSNSLSSMALPSSTGIGQNVDILI